MYTYLKNFSNNEKINATSNELTQLSGLPAVYFEQLEKEIYSPSMEEFFLVLESIAIIGADRKENDWGYQQWFDYFLAHIITDCLINHDTVNNTLFDLVSEIQTSRKLSYRDYLHAS